MTGILLVHGAWHGPWCWENFIERLAERGHAVRAVQLRGHDRPPGRIWHRVRHYVEDVQHAVGRFSEPPVLVGHSLGGLVVQKYLERHPAPAAVLMASVPPRGTIAAVARQAVQHPMALLKTNLLLRLAPFVSSRKLARELFFRPETPQEIVERCFAQLQDESYLAFIDTIILRARPRLIQAPVLVLGAGRDTIFTVAEVRETARAYGTEAEIFPDLGHDLMLDTGWQQVADRIDDWIRGVLAPAQAPPASAS